jgi:hypothetical protein
MLKPILILLLIALSQTSQQETPPREEPDLVATRFSWIKSRQNAGLIRGAQNPGGPITTPMPAENRDLGSRKVDLRNNEKRAAISVEEQGNIYHLLIEVKNNGTKIAKAFVWEFRPTGMRDDYEPKQYLCALKVKPKDKKSVDLWTPYAPSKVVSAALRPDGLKDGDVRINKIEYADGSVWKRSDWHYTLPPDASEKAGEGKCSVFER